jgi:hypothetical protein
MNPLCESVITGTTGELLVQLRLFQYEVQAAPPLKDSGNDLIAVRGEDFKAVQVKTTGQEDGRWQLPDDKDYHILALVRLAGEGINLHLDGSDVYLVDREFADSNEFNIQDPSGHEISKDIVDDLFPSSQSSAPVASET